MDDLLMDERVTDEEVVSLFDGDPLEILLELEDADEVFEFFY